MALLYGRAGRLTAKNGGFRPGQYVYSIPACGEPWFPSVRCQPDCNATRCDPSVSNYTKWLDHYHNTVVNERISRDKAGIAMMATTEDGEWNCFPSSMRQRAAQLSADGVPELAIFELFPMAAGKCSAIHSRPHHCTCSDAWFPMARDFLAGRLTVGALGASVAVRDTPTETDQD